MAYAFALDGIGQEDAVQRATGEILSRQEAAWTAAGTEARARMFWDAFDTARQSETLKTALWVGGGIGGALLLLAAGSAFARRS
ncbi:MAG: hypothetical protein ACREM3_15180 [Candidatus Rokuibacteriota bacterium]